MLSKLPLARFAMLGERSKLPRLLHAWILSVAGIGGSGAVVCCAPDSGGGPASLGLASCTFGTHGVAGPGAPAGANLAVLAVDTVFRHWPWNSRRWAEVLISDARAFPRFI